MLARLRSSVMPETPAKMMVFVPGVCKSCWVRSAPMVLRSLRETVSGLAGLPVIR